MTDSRQVVEIESVTLKDLVDRLTVDATVIVARRGEPAAAVMSIDALRKLDDERELLRRLALGELESAAGEGDDVSAVLEDCRLMLEEN